MKDINSIQCDTDHEKEVKKLQNHGVFGSFQNGGNTPTLADLVAASHLVPNIAFADSENIATKSGPVILGCSSQPNKDNLAFGYSSNTGRNSGSGKQPGSTIYSFGESGGGDGGASSCDTLVVNTAELAVSRGDTSISIVNPRSDILKKFGEIIHLLQNEATVAVERKIISHEVYDDIGIRLAELERKVKTL